MIRIVLIDRHTSKDVRLVIKLSRLSNHDGTVSLIHFESDWEVFVVPIVDHVHLFIIGSSFGGTSGSKLFGDRNITDSHESHTPLGGINYRFVHDQGIVGSWSSSDTDNNNDTVLSLPALLVPNWWVGGNFNEISSLLLWYQIVVVRVWETTIHKSYV